MCEVCENVFVGTYPALDIKIKVVRKHLLIKKEGFLKDIRLGFPINYCPQCRKEVVVCHI